MKTEWFGGDNGVSIFPMSNTSKSAYMLFYEKQSLNSPMSIHIDLKSESISGDVRQEIESSNDRFLRLKTYSDSTTLRYLNDLVSKLDRDDGIDQLLHQLVDTENNTIKDVQLFEFLKNVKVKLALL